MNINWTVRIKNPAWWVGLIGAIGTPVLAYMGIAASDITTWGGLGDVVNETMSNPYLVSMVILSVFSFVGVSIDPTTVGISDSARALGYDEPNDDTAGLR